MWNRINTKKDKLDYESKTSEYWKEAKKYVKTISDDPEKPDWFVFTYEQDARWKWELYFSWRLAFLPAGMRYLRQGTINEFLVPCEHPQDFDTNYKPKSD